VPMGRKFEAMTPSRQRVPEAVIQGVLSVWLSMEL